MRLIRNLSFVLLAMVASATLSKTDVSAQGCLDLTGIPECVSCSSGPGRAARKVDQSPLEK